MSRRGVIGAVVVMVLVIGGAVGWSLTRPSPKPDWSAIPAVKPSVGPQVPGVTDALGWAAIGQLDPCRLAEAGRRSHPVEEFQDSPGECNDGSTRVGVGVPYSTADLYDLRRTNLAGYAAWVGVYSAQQSVATGMPTVTPGRCAVVVPTRAGLAITFEANDSASCGDVTATARAALAALTRSPQSLDVAEPRPTACQLLATVARPHGGLHELDACYAGEGLGVHLSDRDDDGRRRGTPVSLDGVQVIASRRAGTGFGGGCAVGWQVADRPRPGTYSWVVTKDCAHAESIARRMIAATAHWTPPTPPGASVFYRFDQPDITGVGACRDVVDQQARRCASHVDRSLPDDPVDLIRHAEADPDVLCTAAAGILHDRSLDLEPVTADTVNVVAGKERTMRACVLADPQHRVEVDLCASRAPMQSGPTTTVAGHHAYVYAPPAGASTTDLKEEIALGAPTDRGSLRIDLDSATGGGVHKPAWFDGFAADVVKRLLSG